jgi:short-subunit dehydrogenase
MEQACAALAVHGTPDWVRLDVSNRESMHAAVTAIRDKHGPIEILVNNAGIAKPGLFADADPPRISKALAVDLVGAVYLTRAVLPDMIAKGWGRVVNISSMMAFAPTPGFVVYSTAKCGLLGFSEALERELRRFPQLRITAVLPPSVKTHAFVEAKHTEPGLMRWSLVPPITVEQVARRTVRGLIIGRRRVYCSAQSYLAWLTERLFPYVMDRILMYMFHPPPRKRLPAKRRPTRAALAAKVPSP